MLKISTNVPFYFVVRLVQRCYTFPQWRVGNAHNHEWLLYISPFSLSKTYPFLGTLRQVVRGRVNEAETSKFV